MVAEDITLDQLEEAIETSELLRTTRNISEEPVVCSLDERVTVARCMLSAPRRNQPLS